MHLFYPLIFSTLTTLATATPLNNANHIFNAIYSSMRQWGSSINHNGMSFFLASMPQGITLYHGTSSPDPLVGVEWLAVDPEHALVFARTRPPHRPCHNFPLKDGQKALGMKPKDGDSGGWLHTYQTTKELRLVYIDGMSAAKSEIGPLDSQDRILFNDSITAGGMRQELQRAKKVCQVATEEWDNRIDGVIRMEAGFEVILCATEHNLNPVRITRSQAQRLNDGHDGKRRPDPIKGGELLRVLSSRYNGIGGNRVAVNYDHFLSVYNSSLDLFPRESDLPRLEHLPAASIQLIRKQLTDLVMNYDVYGQVNWQAIADMIVGQYGRRLRDLAYSSRFSTIESLSADIARFWTPFLDPDNSSCHDEIQRCSGRFIPNGQVNSSSLAYNAVYSVNEQICSTLATVLYEDSNHTVAIGRLRELMIYLAWPMWKECNGCQDDEFCAIPMWPHGTKKDYDHPRCQEFDSAYPSDHDDSYWGPRM